jgi:hypothetical protein
MNRSPILASLVLGLTLVSSLAHAATYVCTAKDVFSGRSFSESGASYSEARSEALSECEAKTGEACVVQCGSSEAAPGFSAGRGFFCKISDRVGRSWVGRGSDLVEARSAAQEECQSEAGVECQIASCGTLQ